MIGAKRERRTGLLSTGLCWIILCCVGFLVDDWLLAQVAIYLCYGIFAMGLSLIWGQVGILSFGQAIFFGAGAYGFAVVTLGMLPGMGTGVVTGLVFGVGLATVLAWILASLTFAGRGLSGAHFAIVTLCAAAVVEIAVTRSTFLGGYNGLFGVAPFTWGGEMIAERSMYFIMLGVAFAVFLIVTLIVQSPYGTVLEAIRNDENRVAHLGYETRGLKTVAFVIAGALSGLSGTLFAAQFGFVSPSLLGFALSTQVLIWVAVGGRAVPLAAMVGALVVSGAENTLSNTLGELWMLAIGVIFVIVVIAAKDGLFGALFRLSPPRRLR